MLEKYGAAAGPGLRATAQLQYLQAGKSRL